MSFSTLLLTRCGRQQYIPLLGENHQAGPGSNCREQRRRRDSRAEICGHQCVGRTQSRQNRIWDESEM